MKSVLFVCTGNICRSPIAEGLFKHLVRERGDIEVASAGVHAVRGQPPSLYAVQVCATDGVDISPFRSQPLTAALVERATHIFAMTGAHLETIHLLFPHGAEKAYLLREFEETGTTVWRDVPDPIGLGRDVYEVCARTIKNALPSVLAFVEQSEFARPGVVRGGGAVQVQMADAPRPTPTQLSSGKCVYGDALRRVDPEIFDVVSAEEKRQRENIELIASENFTSRAVMEAQGSVLTNKYAEGYPGKTLVRRLRECRHRGTTGDRPGQAALRRGTRQRPAALRRAGQYGRLLFRASSPGDRILTMNLAHGGHLTHGHQANFSGKLLPGHSLRREREDRADRLRCNCTSWPKKHRPKMITAGASAYPRIIDFPRLRQIADSVGALLFIDMAHIAGLVAGGQHPTPVPHRGFCHHHHAQKPARTARRDRVMHRNNSPKQIDSHGLPRHPGRPAHARDRGQGGLLPRSAAAGFKDYQQQIVVNAKALAAGMRQARLPHRLRRHGQPPDAGRSAAQGSTASRRRKCLDHAGITVNKNAIPFDTRTPSSRPAVFASARRR